MEYKAQLVIRSRQKDGVELINQIKALADQQDKTFSDTALELLVLGLDSFNAQANDAGGADDTDTPSAPAQEISAGAAPKKTGADQPVEAAQPAAADAESAAADEPAPADETLSADGGSKSAPISAAEVAQECIAQIQAEAPQAAALVLAGFFGRVGPIQGGRVKNLLQAGLSEEDYNQLMKNLRKTREYRSYRQRVIFER